MQRTQSPDLILGIMTAYQRSAALQAAIELDLFSAIGAGTGTVDDLSERCGASPRGVRVLADFLVVLGLLFKAGRNYRLTRDSAAFLDRRSPAYIGTAAEFIVGAALTGRYQRAADAVRHGGATDPNMLAAENPSAAAFARGMGPLMVPVGHALADLLSAANGEPWMVLDVGASHGMLGIAIAQRNSRAEIVAVDWPDVLAVARRNAESAGVADRLHTLPGDVFDLDLGAGYDIVLLGNFLHQFDSSTCALLLRKLRPTLKVGGRVVAVDYIASEDRTSSATVAMVDMTMLVATRAGRTYTMDELHALFTGEGFHRCELHPLPGSPESAVIGHAE